MSSLSSKKLRISLSFFNSLIILRDLFKPSSYLVYAVDVTTSFYTFIIIFIIIYFIQFNPTISSIPCPQIVHIVTFPHANIISNVKHVHLFYIIIVYTPQLLFLNPGFILKTPLPLMLLLYLIHLTSSSHVPHMPSLK